MEDLQQLRTIYKLKNVERATSVGTRKESSAEHSWSCLMLADYFLSKTSIKLDRLKVYDLLMYHDLVEIEAGDFNIIDVEKRKQKQKFEKEAAQKIKKQLPAAVSPKFIALFEEFEGVKTIEAQFAKAIDALDAVIHELNYKEDWKGWSEDFLRKTKGPLFEKFPELKRMFEQTTTYARENGYFNQ